MKRLLFILLALIPFPALSQQTPQSLDSLQNILAQKQAAQDRLGEAEALYGIGNYYYEKQEDKKALEYMEKALRKLPEGSPTLKGKILYRKGMLINFIGEDLTQCLPLFDTAYILLKPANAPVILAPFLQSYGSILIQHLQNKKGMAFLLEAEQMYLQHPDISNTDRLLNIYALLLSAGLQTGDFQACLEYARKGINVGKKSSNYELLADLHYNNALVFYNLGYDKETEEGFLKALELNKKAGVTSGIIRVATALGQHYSNHGKPVLGLQYIQEAKKTAVESSDFYQAAVVDMMESEYWYTQKDFPRALAAINACLRYFEEQQDPRLIQGTYQQKALVLKDLGQLDAAEEWAKKELEQARQANSFNFLLPPCRLLADIEKERGNFKEALGYQEQYALYKDSIYHTDLESKLAEERTRQNIEAESDARKKAELEAALLASRNQLFATITGALLLFLLIGGYLFWQLRISKRQLQVQNTSLATLNATKDKFFGIIAHDLRNPLAAFQGIGDQLNFYLEKGDSAKLKFISTNIAKSATNLNNLLDNLLSWALLNRGMIPYHPEPLSVGQEVSGNLAIHENAAQAKSIQLENHIAPDLQILADRNAFQAILRNMIGNAIKFTLPGGRVQLTGKAQNGQVLICVEDTGVGISAEKLDKIFSLDKRSEHGTAGEKGAGLGLLLCKELVELNQGTMTATSVPGAGSKFEFSLPQIES